MNTTHSPVRFLRKKEVLHRTGLSNATLYRHIQKGEFIPPIAIGARAVGFLESEVDAINCARVQGKNIKDVVAILLVHRTLLEVV